MLQDSFVTRRQFVGAGAAALTLVAMGPAVSLPEDLPAPYRAIYDERFEPARRFAADAARRGWITRAIRGDVTHVWYRELASRWRRGPAPIAGLTTAQSLFVLERLAWDVGMRVTERIPETSGLLVGWRISVPQGGGARA